MQKYDLRYNSPYKTMFGKQISQERAQIILPMLVERVNERETISFGELAEFFDMRFALPIVYPVGCITGTLYRLERNELGEAKFKWEHERIPRIANMVTKSNGEPTGFVKENLSNIEDFQPLLDRIYDYDQWNEVLKALGVVELT